MDIKDGLKKIGDLIKLAFAEVEIQKHSTDYPLADGSVLTLTELKVGAEATVAGQPCPDGSYVIEDGTTITTSNGLISEITPKEIEADPPVEMQTPEQMRAVIESFADSTTASPELKNMAIILKACFEATFGWQLRQAEEKAAVDAAIAAYKTGFEKQESIIKIQNDALKEMHAVIEAFADESKHEPTEQIKEFSDMTPLEKRRFLKAANQ